MSGASGLDLTLRSLSETEDKGLKGEKGTSREDSLPVSKGPQEALNPCGSLRQPPVRGWAVRRGRSRARRFHRHSESTENLLRKEDIGFSPCEDTLDDIEEVHPDESRRPLQLSFSQTVDICSSEERATLASPSSSIRQAMNRSISFIIDRARYVAQPIPRSCGRSDPLRLQAIDRFPAS